MEEKMKLHSEETIELRLSELADRITKDYAGKTLDIVYITNGATILCADLIRKINIPVRIHPMSYINYSTPTKSGEVRITLDIAESLYGKDVLLLDGIIISGRTPFYIHNILKERNPATLKVCALGIKPHLLSVPLEVSYFGFEFKDEIVMGYGIGEGQEKAIRALYARNATS